MDRGLVLTLGRRFCLIMREYLIQNKAIKTCILLVMFRQSLSYFPTWTDGLLLEVGGGGEGVPDTASSEIKPNPLVALPAQNIN